MKNIRKLITFVITIIMIIGFTNNSVYAMTTTQDGLEISLTTDKEEYVQGDKIVATLTIINTNNFPVKNITIDQLMPSGYKLSDDALVTKHIDLLEAGKSITLSITYISDDNLKENNGSEDKDTSEGDNAINGNTNIDDSDTNGDTTIEDSSRNDNENSENSEVISPLTGDTINVIVPMVLLLFSGICVIVCLFRKNKKVKRILSIFLCITIISTLVPMNNVQALADTIKTCNIATIVKIDGSEVRIEAKLEYDFETISEDMDNDADGVNNNIERILGTDPNLTDTDGDGLSDYQEAYLTGTDPIFSDTNENGIFDGEEDADNDGLSNLTEVRLNTDPLKSDSDNDGISDFDEVETYYTNPLLADSDGDGIIDGDEILLGLNPLEKYSDGTTLDSNRTISQTIDPQDDLLKDNNAIPTLSGNVTDLITNHVTLEKTEIEALSDSRAIVGKQVCINTDYPNETDLQLSFDCSSELDRIDNLMICRYENNEIVPCETIVNQNILKAKVSTGSYFVMDAEELLKSFGINIKDYILSETYAASTLSLYSAEKNVLNNITEQMNQENDLLFDSENNYNVSMGENDGEELETFTNNIYSSYEYVLNSSFEENEEYIPVTYASNGNIGQADIVFVIDSTGSMGDEINNVAKNINAFVTSLTSNYSVQTNFALIDYKDITCDGEKTSLIKNGTMNWFSDVNAYKNEINNIFVDGGGDDPETVIDALGMASRLDYRQNANKFIILVTDADYKVDNSYGILSMSEMAEILKNKGIVTSVITTDYQKSNYGELYQETNGVYANIYGNFSDVLMQLADKIGEIVNDGTWVVLSDYQFVKLEKPLEEGGDSDNDGVIDSEELGDRVTSDLTPYINWVLNKYDIPKEMYTGSNTIDVYNYKSNPLLVDTDYDGIYDNEDIEPKNGTEIGKMTGYSPVNCAQYTMNFRKFFNSNTVFDKDICLSSLVLANTIYNGSSFIYNNIQKKNANSEISDIKALMEYHGFENVIDYKLKEGYNSDKFNVPPFTDDDISEIGIGYHNVVYRGVTKTIVGVVIRGTNGTVEEWSSNFDMGNPNSWESEYHKGFYNTEERIKDFVQLYCDNYVKGKENITYWVTGHSRGAALANILAARLVDDGNEVFAYTFATPSTTISSSQSDEKYASIFNFANTSDFVTYVPLKEWKFGRFGITYDLSIEDSGLEVKWMAQTGGTRYNALNKSLITVATGRIAKSCSPTWESVFECSGAQNINDKQYSSISERAKRYCTINERKLFGKHMGYKLYPSTAFIFQLGAEVLGGESVESSLFTELWNSKYSSVILLFLVNDGGAGDVYDLWKDGRLGESLVGDGHAPATYYVLVEAM